MLFSGADVYSVTIIVSAFMGGLGIGSLAGGRLADRLGPAHSLWGFAAAEALIGGFGFLSKSIYYDTLAIRLPELGATPAVAAVVLFASLLVPTFLMGVSLPLLARALTADLADTGRVIGSLYGWNTIGAAVGAFASTWILLPRFGLEQSLMIGASVNLTCALGATLIATAAHKGRPYGTATAPSTSAPSTQAPSTQAPSTQHSARAPAVNLPFAVWAMIYALTGFIALGLEIAWFRLLGVMLKSTAFTFGTLLTVYLTGLGTGGAIGARVVGRSHSPGQTFLLLQLAITVYAAASVALLAALIDRGHPAALVNYLGGYDPLDVAAALHQGGVATTFTLLYVALPILMVGPPTFLMGFSFPYLQRASHSDLQHLGQRLGVLMSSNIAGAVLGAMLTGWVLLPIAGTAGTLRILVALAALLAWPLWLLSPRVEGRKNPVVPLVAVVVTPILVAALPSSVTLWARLHAAAPRQIVSAEDGSGLSVLKAEPTGRHAVFVNGLGQSWIPFGGIHTVLGALPAIVHPSPREVLIIGLGSGDTCFAAAGRSEVQRVTCVEIIGAQLDTLRRLSGLRPYPGLTGLLSDRRIEHKVGDGRAFLVPEGRRFDVIEADALRPTSAYAGNLYSREYFDLLRRRLTPGGLAVTWAPTERTIQTFASVFPHAAVFGDIAIGSDAPISFDRATIATRTTAVRDYFFPAGIDIVELMRPYVSSMPRVFDPSTPRRTTDLNSDLFPRDEFAVPQ